MGTSINLSNLGGGVAIEKFDEELARVVDNILDPNTDPGAKREVVIKVSVVPSKDRKHGDIEVSTSTKLAPSVSYSTQAFFGQSEGKPVAFENNPHQVDIYDFIDREREVPTIQSQKQQQPQSAQATQAPQQAAQVAAGKKVTK